MVKDTQKTMFIKVMFKHYYRVVTDTAWQKMSERRDIGEKKK